MFGARTYAYADDLAVFVKGKLALKKVLAEIEAWMDNNLMKINYKKCGVFNLHTNSCAEE